jgi:zinc transport system permease protein
MFELVLSFKDALFGALVIGIACSTLGVYVVLRRIVFVGAALAQLSSAGIALALFLGGLGVGLGLVTHPIALSLIVTLAGALFFAGGTKSRIPQDATIGVTYAAAGAAGILLIAKAAGGEAHDIFLQGNILGMTRRDVYTLLAVTIPVLLLHIAFYKEFLFVSFDRETARTLGYNVRRWTLLLYLTLGLVIAFAMQFAGVMLVFSFLVLPAVTGLLVARSMTTMFVVSVSSAILAAVVGFALSVPYDLPSGPSIVAASSVIVGLGWLARLAQRR